MHYQYTEDKTDKSNIEQHQNGTYNISTLTSKQEVNGKTK